MGKKDNNIDRPEMILSLIDNLRNEEGIPVRQMTYGLCDNTLFVKALSEKNRKMDKWLIDSFYQRLGKNMRNFECLLDADEYAMFEMREDFRDAFSKGDMVKARKAAERYASMELCETRCGHRQIAELFKISIMLWEKTDGISVLKKAYEAIRLTIPGFELKQLKNFLFTEIELILINIIMRQSTKVYGEEYTYPFYRELFQIYQQERYSDNEQVIWFAPMIYAYSLILLNRKAYNDVIQVADVMIRCLVADNKIHYLAEFLECKGKAKLNYFFSISGIRRKEKELLEEMPEYAQAKAIKEIYASYYPEWSPDNDIQIYWEYNILPTSKIVKQRRELMGLTQEDLTVYDDEVICSTDTIARLEKGKSKVRASVERRILSRLRLPPDRFHREYMSDSYEDIRQLKSFVEAETRRDEKKAEVCLKKLENAHSLRYFPSNEQYIKQLRLYKRIEKEPDIYKRLSEYRSLLGLTLCNTSDDRGRVNFYPFDAECALLINIAAVYRRLGEPEMIVRTCKDILHEYQSIGKYDNTFYPGIVSVGRILASELGNLKKFDESDRIAEDMLIRCLKFNRLDLSRGFLFCLAWNTDMDERKKIKNKQTELRAVFALAEIGENNQLKEKVRNHCRLYYSEDILENVGQV